MTEWVTPCLPWQQFLRGCVFSGRWAQVAKRSGAFLTPKKKKSTDQTVRRRPLTAEAFGSISDLSMWDLWPAKRNEDRSFSECFGCTLSVAFHPCSILSPIHNKAYRANLILFIACPVQSQIYKQFKLHCIAQYFSERFRIQRVGEHHKNMELTIF